MSEPTRPVKSRRSTTTKPDARRERWKEHRQARRNELVEAAVRAISQHGRDVGMDDIAAEAGISKPVLYRHFSDKNDLYLAVSEWGTQLLMRRVGPVLVEEGSARQRIHRIVSTYLGLIEQYPELYRFVVQRTFADRPIPSDPVTQEKTEIANTLSRVIGEFLRSVKLDSGGAEPWSHGLVGMVQASGDWWLEHRTMSREDLTNYLAEIIWHALDGVLRSGGIVIDPDEVWGSAAALRPVPDIAPPTPPSSSSDTGA